MFHGRIRRLHFSPQHFINTQALLATQIDIMYSRYRALGSPVNATGYEGMPMAQFFSNAERCIRTLDERYNLQRELTEPTLDKEEVVKWYRDTATSLAF